MPAKVFDASSMGARCFFGKIFPHLLRNQLVGLVVGVLDGELDSCSSGMSSRSRCSMNLDFRGCGLRPFCSVKDGMKTIPLISDSIVGSALSRETAEDSGDIVCRLRVS